MGQFFWLKNGEKFQTLTNNCIFTIFPNFMMKFDQIETKGKQFITFAKKRY